MNSIQSIKKVHCSDFPPHFPQESPQEAPQEEPPRIPEELPKEDPKEEPAPAIVEEPPVLVTDMTAPTPSSSDAAPPASQEKEIVVA